MGAFHKRIVRLKLARLKLKWKGYEYLAGIAGDIPELRQKLILPYTG